MELSSASCLSLILSFLILTFAKSLSGVTKDTQNKPNGLSLLGHFELVGTVDPRFLSFAIDSHQLMKQWKSVKLENETLIKLATALHPAVLRIGGTDADVLRFDENGATSNENDNCSATEFPPHETSSINGQDVLRLGKFVEKICADLVYNLNVLDRQKKLGSAGTGLWNSTNSVTLLKFFRKHKIPVYGLQLGNEPDSFLHVFNRTVSSLDLAADFGSLKRVLKGLAGYSKTKLIGPDTTRPRSKRGRSSRFLKGFLKQLPLHTLDAVSFHQYYFAGKTAVLSDFVNVTTMDQLQAEIRMERSMVSRLRPELKILWLGETSSAWGGGSQNISDRFVATFMWIDKLGQAGLNGVSLVIRQTLIGGAYGLIREDMTPTPNYFASLLHKRLVGHKVLKVPQPMHEISRGLRLYAHCTVGKIGSVTIFGINVDAVDHHIPLLGHQVITYEEYLLQAPLLNSTRVYLNGHPLDLGHDGSIPTLNPVPRTNTGLDFPAMAIGFWVFPGMMNHVCV